MAHDADDDARGAVVQRLFDAKAEWHRAQARLPVREGAIITPGVIIWMKCQRQQQRFHGIM